MSVLGRHRQTDLCEASLVYRVSSKTASEILCPKKRKKGKKIKPHAQVHKRLAGIREFPSQTKQKKEISDQKLQVLPSELCSHKPAVGMADCTV